jgi:hypothetical protein
MTTHTGRLYPGSDEDTSALTRHSHYYVSRIAFEFLSLFYLHNDLGFHGQPREFWAHPIWAVTTLPFAAGANVGHLWRNAGQPSTLLHQP